MKKKRWWKAGVFLLLAILLVVGLSVSYGAYIQQTVEAETSDYIEELSKQSIRLIHERLSNDYLYLEGIAKSIGSQNKEIYADTILEILLRRTETTRFTRLAVADIDGTVYYKNQGKSVNVTDRNYFQKALNGETSVECVLLEEDGSREIVTAVPIVREGKVIGVILGQYAMDKLQRLMEVDYFDGQGFVFIVRANGEILVRDEQDSRAVNDFKELADNDENDITQGEMAEVYKDMVAGKNGALSYMADEKTYLMSYTAMGINDWYLISVIPKEIINSRTLNIFNATVVYGIGVFIVLGISGIWVISNWKKSHNSVQRAYKNIESIYRTVPGAVVCFLVDDGCRIINANEAFYNTIGCTRQEFDRRYGKKFLNILQEDERDWFKELEEGLCAHEFRLENAVGKELWLYGNFDVQRIEGKRVAQAALADTTQQRERLTKAEMTARIDVLTGLKNKRAVEAEMGKLLTECGGKGSFLVMDLDNFKQVNDTFGHLEGDKMLRTLADCVRDVFRADDFAGRIGGDEFLVFMRKISRKDIAAKKAEQLISQFDARLPHDIRKLGLSVSIGIALGPRDGDEYLKLYEKADKALYAAKNSGRKCWRFWDEL